MIAALAFFTVIGIGLWEELSEQRRLAGMARDCEARRGRQ